MADAAYIRMRQPEPWLVLAAERNPRDEAILPRPFEPREREGTCDLETAHRWATQQYGAQRVLPIVREQDRPWWRTIVADVPATNIVEEPVDRGSAPGFLVATLRISRWDPGGRVVLVSTDRRRPWNVIFEQVHKLVAEPEDHRSVRIDGRIAVGTTRAFLELFSRVQPGLFLAFCKRPNAVWDLATTYPFIDHTDVWEDVLSAETPRGFRLTPAREHATAAT